MRRINYLAAPLAVLLAICTSSVQGAPPRGRATAAANFQRVTAQRTSARTTAASSGIVNTAQMVVTPMGIMHKAAAIRLGLPFTPFPSGGSNGGGTQNPNPR